MKNLQTAVEYLLEQIKNNSLTFYNEGDLKMPISLGNVDVVNQAKEMEKEQIMRAYMSGEIGEMYELKNTLTAKQYYENNYEKTN